MPAPSRRAFGTLKVAVALCAAVLLLGPRTAFGQQFRFFGTKSFGFGKTKFGLGAGYLSELQKSLTISSSSGTVTVHDLDQGSTETNPLDGDPRLLNRKFDIEWSMNGPGVQVPITILDLHAGSWARISSLLTLQALKGDFDLRFLNQREPGPSDSLHGRVPQYSVELGLRGNLGRKWFAEGGYRFQDIPSVDAERSRPFASPGLQVLSDQSRLSRETHDGIACFGYSFSGGDIVTYTGVRHRRASVEIEDELRLLNPLFNQETNLHSKTKLDGRATEAIVGVEARLRSGSFIGRTEITFNKQDYGIVATLVYAGRPPPNEPSDPERVKANLIAAEIAPQISRIRDEFEKGRIILPTAQIQGIGQAYVEEPLRRLLGKTEQDLLRVLSSHVELRALQDYVRDVFERAREALQLQPAFQAISSRSPGVLASALLVHWPVYLQAGLQKPPRATFFQSATTSLKNLGKSIARLFEITDGKDLLIDLCIKTYPRVPVTFSMHPLSYNQEEWGVETDGIVPNVYRGLYTYTVIDSAGKFKKIQSLTRVEYLNLVDSSKQIITCTLMTSGIPRACKSEDGDVKERCRNGR